VLLSDAEQRVAAPNRATTVFIIDSCDVSVDDK
jgi:hypothetical protein